MRTEVPSSYVLDREMLRLDAYRLLCLFFANKEISRLSDPQDPIDSAACLERAFFLREMTRLLLNIAIALRVLDDQLRSNSQSDVERNRYSVVMDQVNKQYSCMMFDDMPLREVCNKIIHASVVEPDSTSGEGSHFIDVQNWLSWVEEKEMSSEDIGPEPEPIEWQHLSGFVRLGGTRNGEQWWHLLEVPVFVAAIDELLSS